MLGKSNQRGNLPEKYFEILFSMFSWRTPVITAMTKDSH